MIDVSFSRSCRLKENTRVDMNCRSLWVQSSLVSSRKNRTSLLVARSDRGTECLDTLRGRMRIKSSSTPERFCPSRRTCPSTRVLVRQSLDSCFPGLSAGNVLGIFVTWPTNYEGLVGRARLQKGTRMCRELLSQILKPFIWFR